MHDKPCVHACMVDSGVKCSLTNYTCNSTMWEMSLSYKLSLLVYLHGQPVDTIVLIVT